MTELLPDMIQHTVVICVDKRERGIGLQAAFHARGVKAIVTQSLYDGLQTVAQELPHLIISESKLVDGNVGVLYDKLQQSELLRKIPILTCILRKTREELAPLANRQFAGFIVGKPDPAIVLPKSLEILQKLSKTSPFFVPASTCGVGNVVLSTHANAIGQARGMVVVATDNEVDFRSSFHCSPERQDQRSVSLDSGVNLVGKGKVINLFPIHNILGPGRLWINQLQEMKCEVANRTILLSGALQPQDWAATFKAYGVTAKTMPRVEDSIRTALKKQVGAIVHMGSVADPILRKWAALNVKLPGKLPPLLLLAPANHPLAEFTTICPFPSSIGKIMFTVEALLLRYAMFEQFLQQGNVRGTSFTYHNRAQFIGMDETAGYVQLQVPMRPGNKFHAEHPFFDDFFKGQTLTVTKCMPTDAGGTWQIRFEAPNAGQSKARYFEDLLRQVDPGRLSSAS